MKSVVMRTAGHGEGTACEERVEELKNDGGECAHAGVFICILVESLVQDTKASRRLEPLRDQWRVGESREKNKRKPRVVSGQSESAWPTSSDLVKFKERESKRRN